MLALLQILLLLTGSHHLQSMQVRQSPHAPTIMGLGLHEVEAPDMAGVFGSQPDALNPVLPSGCAIQVRFERRGRSGNTDVRLMVP